jgi:hypothetical protein
VHDEEGEERKAKRDTEEAKESPVQIEIFDTLEKETKQRKPESAKQQRRVAQVKKTGSRAYSIVDNFNQVWCCSGKNK